MPQLNKGGKFVFGLSVIHENRSVQIPPQAINEYRLSNENKIIIFTGSKITGGFCVTSYPLLSSSKLSHILKECHDLAISLTNNKMMICIIHNIVPGAS